MPQDAEWDIMWEVSRNGEELRQGTNETMEEALNKAIDVIVADVQIKLGYDWEMIRQLLLRNPDMTAEEAAEYTGFAWSEFNRVRPPEEWMVTVPREAVAALLTRTEDDNSYDWEDWEAAWLYDLVARVGEDGFRYTIRFD